MIRFVSGWRRVGLVVGLLIGLLLAYVGYLVHAAGEFKRLSPHVDGRCSVVTDLPGPEDLVVGPDGRTAWVSAFDRRAQLEGRPAEAAVYTVDLEAPDLDPVRRTQGPDGFHPHGLGLHVENGRAHTLMVVSHPRGDLKGDVPGEGPAHTIEVYDVLDDGGLRHRNTVTDPLLISPNDVAPVGPDSFYVTNDHGTGDPTVRKVEDYLRLGRAHLLFCDPSGCQRLPGGFEYANGIQVSADGSEVYVAAPPMRSVFVYDRDARSNALALRTEVFLGTGPDNLNIDDRGRLWIGAHPKLLTLAGHLDDGQGSSPSQVLRLDPDGTGGFAVHEVLLSTGEDYGASTAAVWSAGRLLVGGVFGPGLLDCRLGD